MSAGEDEDVPYAAVWTLCERELVRFFRQRNRVLGALIQPVLFWILFGQGLSGAFRPTANGAVDFGEYFFPGIVVMIVLFTAIYSTISIIEDRREGFLQEVLIAPVPRWSVALGKVGGGTAIAVIQGVAFLALAPVAGIRPSLAGILATTLLLVVLGVGLTSVGVCIAWRTDSVQGFHAVMTVLLFPMWLLSGAFFPMEGAPGWIAWVMRLNPLSYGVAGVRRLLYFGTTMEWSEVPGLAMSVGTTIFFAAAAFSLAVWIARAQNLEGK